ncbi:AF4/FMR2 family member 4 [Drosophila pseudoobscura]|uniref:AF4/FMR2 family member 4 n=1 Tax=Drosophila pseudoobscura pseudoobscura TaxID=46245 RepID=A0A6I8VAA2_DROPS|nr:AF4/FMR2 family member 4 [Drosophila pseudoobscura]
MVPCQANCVNEGECLWPVESRQPKVSVRTQRVQEKGQEEGIPQQSNTMFPQAELENYKLQVELLQEKLQRSEDNRQQLEHKLDKILQKRSDLDKSVRLKSRQKYQEFLEEQTVRNERNKKLIHMLERIDEQTVAMSQRSERLKMMKLQYQMYFAKLVQNQTLRCIQQQATQATAPSGAGVGVGAAAAAVGGGMPIQVLVPPQAAAGMPTQPMAAAAAPPQWTLAMATPTHGGMLLTPQFATPSAGAPPGAPGPMPMPPQGLYYPEMYGATGTAPLGTSNLFDLRATLRAFDNENADLPERMTHFNAATSSQAALTGDYQAEASGRATPASASASAGGGGGGGGGASTTTSSLVAGQDKGARQLSSTSSTLATSSLTFDKLPKTSSSMTLTEMPLTTLASTAVDDVGGQPQMAGAAAERGREMRRSWSREQDHEHEGVADMAAWTNSRVTKVEYEKSPTVVGHNEPGQRQPHPQQQQQQQQHHNFEAYFGELKIDEPWQPGASASPSPSQSMGRTASPAGDRRQQNVRPGEGGHADGGEGISVGAKVCLTNDLLDEVIASRAALAKAAAAVDEQLARSNQLPPPVGNNEHAAAAAAVASSSSWNPKPGVSIENIENAIYGERLTGTATGAASPAAVPAEPVTRAPTQGFFENLGANTSPQEQADQHTLERIEEVQRESQPEPEVTDYGQYDASSYGESSEPIYASIDSASQQQQQPPGAPAEPLYSEIGNPTDYQQYATDASAEAGAGAEAGAVAGPETDAAAGGPGGADGDEAGAMQQEYSNIDYGNYEAGQYAAGYDPNAYPGYIYDEATGQYIADPNAAQYAPDGSYAGQEYDGSAANYDYGSYAEQQQQSPQEELQQMQAQVQEQGQQEQQEQQEAYPMTNDNGQSGMELEQSQQPLAITPAAIAPPVETKVEPTAAITTTTPVGVASKPVKPTSILSTTDKQAAPNDAQQQQQKKKKRVNFVDSSETDDSSSAKPAPAAASATGPAPAPAPALGPTSGPPTAGAGTGGATTTAAGGSESDFDFSTGSEAKN